MDAVDGVGHRHRVPQLTKMQRTPGYMVLSPSDPFYIKKITWEITDFLKEIFILRCKIRITV